MLATEHPMTQPPQVPNERIYKRVWETPEEASAEIERLMNKIERLKDRLADSDAELFEVVQALDFHKKDGERLDYLQSKSDKGAFSLSIYRRDETVRGKIDAMMNPASSPYGPRIEELKKTIREAQDELYILAGNSDV
jgi:hypothetical protein